MSYSINPVLHNYKDRQGLQRIMIQVIYNRQKAYAPTPYKVQASNFERGKIIGTKDKTRLNAALVKQCAELHTALLKMMDRGPVKIEDLKALVQGKGERTLLADFAKHYLQTAPVKQSTRQMYGSVVNVVLQERPGVALQEIDQDWLLELEEHLRHSKGHNTVHKIMRKLKSLLYQAAERDLIEERQFSRYSPPLYRQPVPEYLSEEEIQLFKRECDQSHNENKRLAGYYFLLSCYAGFRLDDALNFNYKARIRDGQILLSTKKKDRLVSMPVHTRLQEVLDYIKDRPNRLSEYHVRQHVYSLAKMAGIDRKIKFHTSRHTFAMLLMDNGFSIEEVAELLGNSLEAAQIYARISNKRLQQKVIEKLK